MPAASALAPSMTQSTPDSASRPRATRSANRAVTTVLFSVSPSHSPTGTLVPSVVMTRATTTHEPATSSPSIMRTATSRSERFRAISSPMALVVAATKRRETADLDMDFERPSSSSPTGSATSRWRRVATPASMRSTTRELSRSAELNAFQVSSPISSPAAVRPRGRSVLTWRPPSTTEPLVVPCQFPTRSGAGILACFSPIASVSSACHHLVHDDEPGGRRERQQPVFDRPGHLGQGDCRLQRQVSQSGCLLRVGDAHNSYLLLHGGPLPGFLGGARSLPAGRSQAGDHRLTSTIFGTTFVSEKFSNRPIGSESG